MNVVIEPLDRKREVGRGNRQFYKIEATQAVRKIRPDLARGRGRRIGDEGQGIFFHSVPKTPPRYDAKRRCIRFGLIDRCGVASEPALALLHIRYYSSRMPFPHPDDEGRPITAGEWGFLALGAICFLIAIVVNLL